MLDLEDVNNYMSEYVNQELLDGPSKESNCVEYHFKNLEGVIIDLLKIKLFYTSKGIGAICLRIPNNRDICEKYFGYNYLELKKYLSNQVNIKQETDIKQITWVNNKNPSEYKKFIESVMNLYKQNDELDDLEEYKKREEYLISNEVDKESLIKSRIGQGKFRRGVIELWNGKCSVTGLENTDLLIASHILPWISSNKIQKLDRCNGLLLIPNLDKLFDKGFISFKENGAILISDDLNESDRDIFNLQSSLCLHKKIKKVEEYMKDHRKNIFKGTSE